ncbi:HPr family phosphocarrier protein [Domibacillus sp. DTU_2020_1001157_1_SI_ALB_TIR_016]|uniref:HPr family phosphocarrier protein n=1 Tax=Domibacillus sp. DTU_2020_1001157_1_SI_ALB_TIR_016 TaxID=3077789 RepID=UPI0028E7CCEB|nr:HPr family phosphocarrier protein [Domibacillus sp. DTU_2020_1001157_1_SI_ALB_TIR_016]WNS79107.1 HPr family phosphocarrier protein [Domibacillus sp. DTU_2020_1001157_1_SI_ALB_TIR_016]
MRIEKKIVVCLKKGLQARIAAQFVELASSFNSEIMIIKKERSLSAKSIIGVMGAAIRSGEDIVRAFKRLGYPFKTMDYINKES